MKAAAKKHSKTSPVVLVPADRHPKGCDCDFHALERATEIVTKARQAGVKLVDPKQTVYVKTYTVRAHMRRNKRHLNKKPHTLAVLTRLITQMAARQTALIRKHSSK